MIFCAQIVALIVALVCISQSIKPESTKVEKVMYCLACFAYIGMCVMLEGVK